MLWCVTFRGPLWCVIFRGPLTPDYLEHPWLLRLTVHFVVLGKVHPTSRLPSEISDSWLRSLPLATSPPESVHYTGRQLQNTMKNLMVKMDEDEPVEEYKSLRHAKLTDNCNEARRTENKSKNRYRNVLPCKHMYHFLLFRKRLCCNYLFGLNGVKHCAMRFSPIRFLLEVPVF